MFYSHQLLSKKGPFGQIWIAATMHPKMNRKKAEQIDIEQSCEQIINPVVPLALRLSGILMGGIVRIYHHKVKFLHDDANEFLMKVKFVIPASRAMEVDTTTLPRGRTRARLEAITNETQEMFTDDIELPMAEPDTPEKDDEFFVIPASRNRASGSRRSNEAFQAANEDITLEEDNLRSFVDRVSELERDDDRILPPDTFVYPEFKDSPEVVPEVPEERRKKRRKLASEVPDTEVPEVPEEVPEVPEVVVPEVEVPVPEVPEEVEPPLRKKRRKGIAMTKRKRQNIMDDEMTEVPAQMFSSWLEDTSSIVNCRDKRKMDAFETAERTKAMLFAYPATFFTCGTTTGPGSLLPKALLDLWNPKFKRPAVKPRSNAAAAEDVPAAEPAVPEPEEVPRAYEAPAFGFEQPPPPADYEGTPMGPQAEFDYGSVERLRTAFHTPSTGGGDDVLGSQLGYTPVFSAADRPTSASGKAFGGRVSGDFLTPTLTPSLTPAYKESAADPRENIDKITTTTLKCLREHFYIPGIKEQSLDELTEGMDVSAASKLFFQICVLVSNRFITVNQRTSYGDIMIGRGDYL